MRRVWGRKGRDLVGFRTRGIVVLLVDRGNDLIMDGAMMMSDEEEKGSCC